MPESPKSAPFWLAVLVILTALIFYDVMGAIIKSLSGTYSTEELLVFRNLFGLIPVALVLLTSKSWAKSGRPLAMVTWPRAVLRGAIGILSQLCFYSSLLFMEFATASALVFAMPLFVTALSRPVLGTQIGPLRWFAVAVGFAGVLWVIRPDLSALDWRGFLPVLAALGFATSAVIARTFPPDVHTGLINLYTTLTGLFGAVVMTLLVGGFTPITFTSDFVPLITIGLTGGTAAYAMTSANRMADPSDLAPFHYFGIPSAFVIGWFAFGEAPFADLIPGVFLIVGGGLFILWRERLAKPR